METVKQSVGRIGEELTARFLISKGYQILDRNYRKKWGEIDIIAQKDNIVHFVEVKANSVSHFTHKYMPEDNVRLWKKQRMARAIKTYFLDKDLSDEQEFEVDVAAIFLDFENKKAKIRMVENVLLS